MDKLKPWQSVVLVLGVVALLVTAGRVLFSGDRIDQPDQAYLIDVRTGDLYVASLRGRRSIVIPARHPETKDRVLFTVKKGEDGRWILVRRYAGGMRFIEGDLIEVGPDFTVTPTSESAIKYVAPPF